MTARVIAHRDPIAERYESARAIDYLASTGEPFGRDDVVELIGESPALDDALESSSALGCIRPVPGAAVQAWVGEPR